MSKWGYVIMLLTLFLLTYNSKNKEQMSEVAVAVSNDDIDGNVDQDIAESDTNNFDPSEATNFYGIANIPVISTYYLKGMIDNKYSFTMNFDVDSCRINGYYRYNNQKKDIDIRGTLKGNKIVIKEVVYSGGDYVPNGAHFDGIFDYDKGRINGTWYSADGKRSLPFTINNYYGKGYPQFDFKVKVKREVSESGYVSLEINELHILNKKTGDENVLILNARPVASTYCISQKDFNFDGYPDLAMMEFIPSYPPNKYLFWLYDAGDNTYYQTDILDEVYTYPEIDYSDSTTTTVTIWHNQIHEQTYKFDGNKWISKSSISESIGGEEEEE